MEILKFFYVVEKLLKIYIILSMIIFILIYQITNLHDTLVPTKENEVTIISVF